VTPAQLRAFAATARCGSVKAAAAELGVSDAAVSLHVAHLRKELGDRLFVPTPSGLAFTPGGLRLASRAVEILGLADRTVLEVGQAASGRRLLRVATSSLFAEHAAPGLIQLFTGRADDLDVELSVSPQRQFASLLTSRAADVAIGPPLPTIDPGVISSTPFLKYQVVVVVGPQHPLAGRATTEHQLRDQVWLLGPSAVGGHGVVATMLQRLRVPEDRQRIFQSEAAALEQAARGEGVALSLSFVAARDVASGRLVRLQGPSLQGESVWSLMALVPPAPAVEELRRFVTTPRATQAMLRGSGVDTRRFRPSVHVTLWS
jgi:DNA-binding transcriptional LysR family regulator